MGLFLQSVLITKDAIIWEVDMYAIIMKDLQALHRMGLTEEMIPDFSYHGWEVISTAIISYLTQEDCQDIHHFQLEAYTTTQKM